MQTTDVHANLLDYDYHSDRPVEHYGLVRTATLIRRARAEAANSLLFDNGDFLQGTPLSDIVTRRCRDWQSAHPVIAAMNALGYDAAGLGNHEFNFGLDALRAFLAQTAFPLTCGNALTHLGDDPAQDQHLLPPYLLLRRKLSDRTGIARDLTIGVLGLIPPQVAAWDHYHLAGRLWLRDILQTARHMVPRMRAAGADLVIVLAHSGIEQGPDRPGMENAALPLSRLPGVDAVLAGHTHQVYPPRPAHGPTDGAAPIVMAGFRGSHLGVLDLALTARDGRWQVTGTSSEARPVAAPDPAPPDPALSELLRPAHGATLRLIRHELGQTRRALHSYFALVGQSRALHLVSEAKRAAALEVLKGQTDPALPILSVSTSYKTGGRGGPQYYSDVAPGALFLRHAADLYPFPNVLCIARITGAELRDWLERSASVFQQITPGPMPQPLHTGEMPGHAFDVITGVTYEIDLSRPALYDAQGNRRATGPGRIRRLTHDGAPVTDAQPFLIVTNNYRANGGGPFRPLGKEQILHTGEVQVVDLLIRHLKAASPLDPVDAPNWRFAPLPGAEVIFDTGPGVRAYPEDIAALGATDLGDTDAGFARFSLRL
ncbi:bifunctional 2',3'-cyclic-nucleotide 2'-phosphodiesterase/3'-nucleotidase [Roseovarius faecimaris]|uniref:bifunctional 2',3'-cyclic-nucleotide 2'-phosphodiesterase/3'-nucleotidase n=1 Tax=Roseovarius faecimaris TaxID=2494550 RepID=UPI001FE6127F|nr:bifunctional 2',3'-cyclic-nucleotide 2'-phosphodiesterase/3'-nucleotidase [Roseovarius faecimaris]